MKTFVPNMLVISVLKHCLAPSCNNFMHFAFTTGTENISVSSGRLSKEQFSSLCRQRRERLNKKLHFAYWPVPGTARNC